MNILPITNQQRNQTQSFGAFRTTDPKVLEGVKELIGDFFPIADVVKKGDRTICGRYIMHFGDLLTTTQIEQYSKNTDLYLTKGDMVKLTRASDIKYIPITLDSIIEKANVITKEALDTVISKVLNTRAEAYKLEQRTIWGLDEFMPNVMNARIEASKAEEKAIWKLGLDA